MTDLKWIKAGRAFPEICREQESYFEQPEESPQLYPYAVTTLPALCALMEARLGDALTPAERLEIAKLAFRNKPVPSEAPAQADREIVDFIYQL